MNFSALDNLTFSGGEVLALLGFAQCVLILVYMAFRVRFWRQALIPAGYFFFLAVWFAGILLLRFETWHDAVRLLLWATRTMGPPMCFLLVLQIASPQDMPRPRHFLALLALPLSFAAAFFYGTFSGALFTGDALYLSGALAGTICLLLVWTRRDLLEGLLSARHGRDKYWLVLSFVTMNVLDIGASLLIASRALDMNDADIVQTLLGIGLAYLVTTGLFRIYPQPLQMNAVPRAIIGPSDADRALIDRARYLLETEKLYQQAGFSRSDLARELGVTEAAASRVVALAFGKSLPQLLNELRIGDAQRLLSDPDIPVNVVASESGFSSIASFNRVFRELTGETPTGWREKQTGK